MPRKWSQKARCRVNFNDHRSSVTFLLSCLFTDTDFGDTPTAFDDGRSETRRRSNRGQ